MFPLMIYFTLPSYTYAEGKQLLQKNLGQSSNVVFANLSFDTDTIPVINNPKRLFVSDREYYYKINFSNGDKYFIVSPVTGEVMQLEGKFW